MSFEQEFKRVLNGRTDFIDTVNKIIPKYETDKFGLEIVEQTTYEDIDDENMTQEEFDNFVPKEYPGYMLFIVDKNGVSPNIYKYKFIEAWLPMESDRQFPVSFEVCGLSNKKKYIVASTEQLESDLESIFKSTQYTNIIKRMDDVLNNQK